MNGKARKILLILVKITISAGLLYWLLRGGMLERVLEETRSNFNPVYFFLGLAAFALSNVLGGCQWNVLLRAQGIRIPWGRAISLYYVGLFFSNFLPANIGGDVVKVVDVYRSTGNGGGAVAATVIDRAIGLALLTILATLSGFFTFQTLGNVPFLLVVPALFLVFLAATLMILSRRVARLVLRLIGMVPFQWVRLKAESVMQAVFQYRGERRALGIALLIALPVQTLRIGVHLLAARAIGVDASAIYFFLFIPIIAVFIALPISINGLGIRESLGVFLYATIGIPQELAFTISFFAYAIGVVVSLCGGGIFILRSGLPKRRMESTPHLKESGESR